MIRSARQLRVAALAAAAFLTVSVAVAAQDATPAPGDDVRIAPIQDATGVTLGWAALGASSVTVIVQGLTPGEHGIHLHTTGDCDPAGESPFAAAGGHLNPDGAKHGAHAGDLGNLTADADGDALFSFAHDLTADLLGDADGTALVIHADPDDGVTDPSGNSGARIACALLVPAR